MEDAHIANESITEKRKTRKSVYTPPLGHIEHTASEDGTSSFHCTICSKSFHSRSQQYYHLGCGSATGKKFKCEQCEKCFASRSHLNYHLDTHHSTQVYHCQQCDRAFGNRAVLVKHQKVHTASASKCEECTKVFRSKAALAAHVAAQHQLNLRFQCDQCEKKYAVKSTLQQHMLKHLAKQHECGQCGKRFQRYSTLKLHLRKHSNSECFVCTICYRNFSDAGALLRHANMHKAAVPTYKCTLCDTSTVRKDNMLRHVRNMHLGESFERCVELQLPSESSELSEAPAATLPTLTTVLHTEADTITVADCLPKTVANSCVIKCIGNVTPIEVPMVNKFAANTNALTFTTLEAVNRSELPAPKAKKIREKYNPIEMYKKILSADMEDEPILEATLPQLTDSADQLTQPTAEKPAAEIRATSSTLNISIVSNFSEMHWRKKATYEYQEC